LRVGCESEEVGYGERGVSASIILEAK